MSDFFSHSLIFLLSKLISVMNEEILGINLNHESSLLYLLKSCIKKWAKRG